MEITIIGTGNMGRGIATRALAGGHDVTLMGTDTEKAQQLADELASDSGAVQAGDSPTGEVVALAVWYPVSLDVARQYADQLEGKVVVDITNPIDTDAFEPLTLDAGSAAQELDAATPESVKVVKAFNTTFAGTLGPGEVSDTQLDVLIAGDDADAKAKVAELVETSGLRAIDVGPLRRARELEALGYLHMAIQDELGTAYSSTVKLIG